MKFDRPLVPGVLIRRYKRFLADVRLDSGETITAACPNTGTMLGLTAPGSRVWLSMSDSPSRKYRHTLEQVEADLGRGPVAVGINTQLPNRLVGEAIAAGRIKELSGYRDVRREVAYGAASRIDFLLEDPARGLAYVEIKNVHLSRQPGLAEFPDCVTARGAKHLGELAAMVRAGHRAVMLYLIQRADAKAFTLASDLDAAYARAYAAAADAGVEMLAYRCKVGPAEIRLDRHVPVRAPRL